MMYPMEIHLEVIWMSLVMSLQSHVEVVVD